MSAEPSPHCKHPYYRSYYMQRHGAAKRGIGFDLTFAQWLSIWEKSKRLSKRGTKKGCYCMARFGDQGPYAISNVEVILHADNVRAGQLGKPKPPNKNAAKLTSNQVVKIKREYVFGSRTKGCHALARKYKVCGQTIHNILTEKHYG